MPRPDNGLFESAVGGGIVYDYINDTEDSYVPEYASVTGPAVLRCSVSVDGTVVDRVWTGNGGSHSWWTMAGGRFLRYPLKPGQRLQVHLDGKGAFRIGWYD